MDEVEAKPDRADTGGAGEDRPPVRGHELLGLRLTRRGVLGTLAFVLLSIACLYFVLPKLVGLRDTWSRIRGGDLWWFGLAAVLELLSFLSYVALFRAVFVRGAKRVTWRVSYEITMAGLAATRLFASAGAGGMALTAWALRRSGMGPRTVGSRMVAFMVLLYGVYMVTLLVVGLGLYFGLFPGPAPFGITVIPAIFGGVVIGLFLAVTLIPGDFESHVSRWTSGEGWLRRVGRAVAAAPAVLTAGVQDALALLRRRDLLMLGAVGWWAFDIAVLWACFHAFGKAPPQAVIVMAYFVGMLGNVLPLPGGIGGVDGGMIGAFTAFGVNVELSIVAVLAYRAFAFWLPTAPGAVAYFQLRRTVQRWRREDSPQPSGARQMARSYT